MSVDLDVEGPPWGPILEVGPRVTFTDAHIRTVALFTATLRRLPYEWDDPTRAIQLAEETISDRVARALAESDAPGLQLVVVSEAAGVTKFPDRARELLGIAAALLPGEGTVLQELDEKVRSLRADPAYSGRATAIVEADLKAYVASLRPGFDYESTPPLSFALLGYATGLMLHTPQGEAVAGELLTTMRAHYAGELV